MSRSLVRQIALAAGSLATIVATVSTVRPVYADRQPVVNRLLAQTWRDSAYQRSPWIQETTAAALATAQFEADQSAFAEDLLATGQVDQERADELASFEVIAQDAGLILLDRTYQGGITTYLEVVTAQAAALAQEEMNKATGGLNLPFKLPF